MPFPASAWEYAQKEVVMAASVRSSEINLALSEEESEHLLPILEQALRDKLVEVHRTEAFSARDIVQHQADVLQSVIDRLRRS
jgi:uncharacterized protein YecA (UPF0149 family)